MPLSSIVVVVLRLFAIQTVVQSLNLALSETASLAKASFFPRDYWSYFGVAGLLLFAALEWFLAPAIARLVTRHHDSNVTLGALSRLDIYSFAFVFLGLYFILDSIAPSLTELHYFLTLSADVTRSESQSSFYDVAADLVTLITGITILLPARRWARKLCEMETRHEVDHQ